MTAAPGKPRSARTSLKASKAGLLGGIDQDVRAEGDRGELAPLGFVVRHEIGSTPRLAKAATAERPIAPAPMTIATSPGWTCADRT